MEQTTTLKQLKFQSAYLHRPIEFLLKPRHINKHIVNDNYFKELLNEKEIFTNVILRGDKRPFVENWVRWKYARQKEVWI